MSNSITRIAVKNGFFGEAVLINEAVPNTRIRGGGTAVKYPLLTQITPQVDFYVSLPRKAGAVKVLDKIEYGDVTIVPRIQDITDNGGRVTNSFIVMAFFAEHVSSAGQVDMKNFKAFDEQIAKIGTGNGDITDFIDFEKTFGELSVLSVVPEYFRDPVTNQVTEEISNYVVTLRSDKQNEIYTVDVLDINSKVKDIPVFGNVKFVGGKARLFRDNSQVENIRVSISMTAQDLVDVKAGLKQPTPPQRPQEQQKPNHQG